MARDLGHSMDPVRGSFRLCIRGTNSVGVGPNRLSLLIVNSRADENAFTCEQSLHQAEITESLHRQGRETMGKHRNPARTLTDSSK